MDEKRYSCEHVVPIEQEPRHHLVIENEFVRAFAVEIAPHDRTLCHHHPHDYLLYVVGDGDIVSAARHEEPKKLSYCDGECELSPAGLVHVVENLRDTPFRNVVVELLPGVGSLRRGDDPKLIAGEANITEYFADARAAIFLLEMKGGSEVLISGPSVVAGTPHGTALDHHVPSCLTSFNDFSHLAWFPSGCQGTLRGFENPTESALVFQVGRTDK